MSSSLTKKVFTGFLISLLFALSGCRQASPYQLEKVSRQTIVQTVSITGTVEADPKIELQFQKSGQIERIFVKEGDPVTEDTMIAQLDNDDLAIQVRAARANLASQQARLEQEIAGALSQEVVVAQVKVDQAETELRNSEIALADSKKINQEKTSAAQLVVNQAELNLTKAQADLGYTQKISSQNVATADLQLEEAEQTLANSQTAASHSQATAEQNVANAFQDMIPKMDEALLTAADNLTAVNHVLGVETTSLIPTSIRLGAKDPSSIQTATNSYKTAKGDYELTKAAYEKWLITKDQATLESMVNDLVDMLALTKKALDDTYVVLSNSVTTGQTGVSSDLKTFTDLIASEISQNIASSKNLQDGLQTYKDTKLALATAVNNDETSQDTAQSNYDQAQKNLETATLNAANDINQAELNLDLSQAKLSQAEQDFAQTKVNNAKLENDMAAQVASRQVALSSTQAEYERVIAEPRQVDLRPLQANVAKAQADLEAAQFNYNQSLLKAPIAGIVVDLKKEIGENITAGEIFAVINTDRLLIKANVAETDIGKVSLQDPAIITFDAFDFADEFSGQVVAVAPAETVIEGVIYYEIKVSYTAKADRDVRSGMTANIKIETARQENVLAVPVRAVKYEDDKRYVEMFINDKVERRDITTGLEGDQYIEVTSGLTEGEEIITFTREE